MPGAALRGFGRAYLSNGGAAWTRKEGKSESGGLNERFQLYSELKMVEHQDEDILLVLMVEAVQIKTMAIRVRIKIIQDLMLDTMEEIQQLLQLQKMMDPVLMWTQETKKKLM